MKALFSLFGSPVCFARFGDAHDASNTARAHARRGALDEALDEALDGWSARSTGASTRGRSSTATRISRLFGGGRSSPIFERARGRSMRAALVLSVVLSGCYASHEGGDGGLEGADAGPSVFAGRWLVDQPSHALYEATIYDLRDDHWTETVCSESFGGPIPTGVVERAADGLRCHFDGPWQSRHEGELAIDAYCDDSVSRTVVLAVTWGSDGAPSEVLVDKVDGERGWMHPWPEWRWLPCARFPEECAVCR